MIQRIGSFTSRNSAEKEKPAELKGHDYKISGTVYQIKGKPDEMYIQNFNFKAKGDGMKVK